MFVLQVYTQNGNIPGGAEAQVIIPIPGQYSVFPIDKHVVDGKELYPDTVRYIVRISTEGNERDVYIHKGDSAYILNEKGETFKIIYRPTRR